MRNAPVQITRLIALSLSLNLLGCASPTPSPPAPEAPKPMIPEGGIAPAMPAPAMTAPTTPTSPTNLGNGAMAAPIPQAQTPPTAATATPPQAPGLIQPGQSPINFDQLQANIPQQIPTDQAAGQLYSLNASQMANVQYPATPLTGTSGYSYGAIPNMLNYGVYNNCLYYPYQGVLIPYTLQGNCYYPYTYASSITPDWSGYYAYPFLAYAGGYYYPYFYYCDSYLFGFADWEYYWPVFREHHHDVDWNRMNSHRRSGTGNFDSWRDRSSRGNRQDSGSTGDRSSRWNRRGSGSAGGQPQRRGNQVTPADSSPVVTPPDSPPLPASAAETPVAAKTAPERPNRRRVRPHEPHED